MERKATLDETRQIVAEKKPKIVFLTGKTCTGKSTFARKLESMGYKHLEFDFVVREKVRDKFKITDTDAFGVYKGNVKQSWQDSFEKSARKLIDEEIKQTNIVIDAAIANPDVLKKILPQDIDLIVVYLHPFDREIYYQAIASRFIDDIDSGKTSFPIWEHVTREIISDYEKNGIDGKEVSGMISEYVDNSIKGSVERYALYQSAFPSLILTGR